MLFLTIFNYTLLCKSKDTLFSLGIIDSAYLLLLLTPSEDNDTFLSKGDNSALVCSICVG